MKKQLFVTLYAVNYLQYKIKKYKCKKITTEYFKGLHIVWLKARKQ